MITESPIRATDRPTRETDYEIQSLGLSTEDERILRGLLTQLRKRELKSLRKILPFFFHIRGKPVSLVNREPFEILFRTVVPRVTVQRCGRQVSKSQTEAMIQVLLGATIPYFMNLYITPLYEMTRRFSGNYIADLINKSPLYKQIIDSNSRRNVLERTFKTGATLTYTFAFLDDTRTRGIPSNRNAYDEFQHFNESFCSTINATLDADPTYKLESYQGTPLGPNNSLNKAYLTTTQSHWVTKCLHGGCGHYNVASWDRDLEKMIGPLHDDIGPKCPGTVCAKCQKPIDCRFGFWNHDFPDLRTTRLGIHVPQPILGIHSHNYSSWEKLTYKVKTYPLPALLNEVMGEPADAGTQLVTVSDLRKAACLDFPNSAREAKKHLPKYVRTAVGVDWGGTGGSNPAKPRISFTTAAGAGMCPDGSIDIFWGHRFKKNLDYKHEVEVLSAAVNEFSAADMAHDYGSGGQQEHILIAGGFNKQRLMPVRYSGPTSVKALMVQKPPTADHPRTWFSLQKTAALALVAYGIRSGFIRFFRYDYKSPDEPGLLHDFLALDEQTMKRRTSGDLKLVGVLADQPDDFAHAVTFACCAMWYREKKWPDMAKVIEFMAPAGVRAKGDYDDEFDLYDWDNPEGNDPFAGYGEPHLL